MRITPFQARFGTRTIGRTLRIVQRARHIIPGDLRTGIDYYVFAGNEKKGALMRKEGGESKKECKKRYIITKLGGGLPDLGPCVPRENGHYGRFYHKNLVLCFKSGFWPVHRLLE
jgi:hypothetical protein